MIIIVLIMTYCQVLLDYLLVAVNFNFPDDVYWKTVIGN